MPYTPPSSTPVTGHPSPRTELPRSSSYFLHQSRRSPSFQENNISPTYTSSGKNETPQLSINPNVRQSPPPRSDAGMPVGAIVSPPESSHSSSDDEDSPGTTRERKEGIKELKAAFRRSLDTQFEFPRSPEEGQVDDASPATGSQAKPTNRDPNLLSPSSPHPARLTASARKISHSRSTTESSFLDSRGVQSAPISQNTSDDSDVDTSDSSINKPPLLRKKSGELVKPAIRPQSRRKHSSMPGTPTYAKAVHFNDDIEQVRHFLQVDRPIAVSAGASPVDEHENEAEFPFSKQSSKDIDWEISLANFPRESLERMTKPVWLERVYLSPDQSSLIGNIAVANIAFHKLVVARFTLDYWKTTSEVMAEYNNDTRLAPRKDGYDPFNFVIKLSDQAHLENKTMLLCIRYNVNGQEHWDNNDNMNFQIDFSKKPRATNEKPVSPGLGARPIPRSRHNSSSMRPRSMPSFDDDFASSFDTGSMIRFRNNTTSRPVLPDTPPPPPTRKQSATTQQFSSRYDFGASLSAALVQAQAQLGDRSGIKQRESPSVQKAARDGSSARTSSLAPPENTPATNSGVESPRPDSLLATKQALDSRAYQEFVSKFCFFGSGKPSHSGTPAKQPPATGDGATDESDGSPSFHSKASHLMNGSLTPPVGLSPSGSGTSSPLPVAGTGPEDRSTNLGLSYPFHQESPSGIFTSEPHTPTAIHG